MVDKTSSCVTVQNDVRGTPEKAALGKHDRVETESNLSRRDLIFS